MMATSPISLGKVVQVVEIDDPFVAAFIKVKAGKDALVEEKLSNGHQIWCFDYNKVQTIQENDLTINISEVEELIKAMGFELVSGEELAALRQRKGGAKRGPGRRSRRTPEEMRIEAAKADIRKKVKARLHLPEKGRMSAEQQARFDVAFEEDCRRAGLE